MRKTLLGLGAFLLAGFAAVTLWRRAGPEVDQAGSAASPERERIRRFWALHNEANALRSKGDYGKAIPLYLECLKLDPRHEDSLYNLGTSHKELGDYAAAVAAFERLIEVNPHSNRGHAELGNTLSTPAPGAVVDFDRARTAFGRSVEINREQAGPFLQLGRLELSRGNPTAAREQFRVAAGFQSPEGNFLLGYTLFLERKHAEAARSFRKVLDTYAHEMAIAKRGVMSEGDILPAPGKPMTALEKSATKSLLFLYWCSRRMGGYPPDTPAAYRIQPPAGARSLQASAGATGPREACPERATLRRAGALPDGTITACVSSDVDRDGRADVLVVRWWRGLVLLLGRDDGRYAEATAAAGLSLTRGPNHGAIVLDYDKDGWLDILVTAQAPYEESVRSLLQPDYRAAKYTPRLFRSTGGAKFEEVTAQAGLTRCYGTMEAHAADFDADGWTDVLLVNGGRAEPRLEPSVILRNVNGGRFEEWAYVPGFDYPGNYASAALAIEGGRTRIALARVAPAAQLQ
jgi:tetratricopeptide (TPR) repeat protein